MNATFLKELRDAAMACSDVDYRALLRRRADILQHVIAWFADEPSTARMQALNGAWVAAVRALGNIPPEAPPAPLSGSPEPARLAA